MRTPHVSIPVGIVVERRKAKSQWIDFVWRPLAVLDGVPDTAPWTLLSEDAQSATFYAGAAAIELFHQETSNYRDNLATDAPLLWVALRPTDVDPPYELIAVTADPSEGEGLTQPGTDLVEALPMPAAIWDALEAFVVEHHVERTFFKRKRDRADPEALARRGPLQSGKPPAGDRS